MKDFFIRLWRAIKTAVLAFLFMSAFGALVIFASALSVILPVILGIAVFVLLVYGAFKGDVTASVSLK